jgi:hypothetical protein
MEDKTEGQRSMLNSKVTYRNYATAQTRNDFPCSQGFGAFIPCIIGFASNIKPRRRRRQ